MSEKASRKTFRIRLEAMIQQLRSSIIEGTYSVGEYLPAESLLAKQYELSNNSVRKGLEVLVEEGFIVKIDKVGSRVIKAAERERVTVTVGCTPSIARDLEFTRLLDDFHALHPSIAVKPVTGTADGLFSNRTYIESIKEQMETGAIDIFTLNNMNFNELVERGYTGLLEEQKANAEMYPFLNGAFAVDGTLYVQPVTFSPLVLCYNRNHFREAKLPEPDSGWKWDDLVQAAARLTVPNQKHGFYFFQVSENRWPLFLLQSGQSFPREGELPGDIRGTRLMEGILLCGELTRNRDIFPNYLSESSTDASRLFLEGKISMLLATYSSLNDFKHSDLDYDISPVPFIHIPITLLLSIGMIVNKHSRQKEAAQRFVDYMASRRAQDLIRRHTISIPAMKPAAEDPCPEEFRLNRPRHYSLFREIIPSYRLHSELNWPARAFESLRHLLKMFWSGLIDEHTLNERLTSLRRVDSAD
ncbi:extracellular solute-binding protein [Paenibacillus mesophilus]|uniref:extracellular solute-binding protein n=1 Tax=Paenibacillus mesophilus TaxID=2582849 RepID=UPI00110D753E|nr:extracellular solute-binding protein [Paenibacillus mesophilus]TMV47327.1 extracellular solute-binding protein [Paenibacillus mesophilus]